MTELDDYVWCSRYEDVHRNTLNPYGYILGQEGICKPEYHRKLYAGRVLTDADTDALSDALSDEAEMPEGISVMRQLHGVTTGQEWAAVFQRQFRLVNPDEVTMAKWFANAIETGRADERLEYKNRMLCVKNSWEFHLLTQDLDDSDG
jgi:hypothetical protein